eukprot:GHVR01028275.1.p1 GENE.GHVR01028275.1~~GHVR01028275.1.p1  ORF type:complete len:128 (+),score=77.98 GHVR01028275.1:437-820(+)
MNDMNYTHTHTHTHTPQSLIVTHSDEGDVTFYRDGRQVGVTTIQLMERENDSFTLDVGCVVGDREKPPDTHTHTHTHTHCFIGIINSIIIYSRVLSPSEAVIISNKSIATNAESIFKKKTTHLPMGR